MDFLPIEFSQLTQNLQILGFFARIIQSFVMGISSYEFFGAM